MIVYLLFELEVHGQYGLASHFIDSFEDKVLAEAHAHEIGIETRFIITKSKVKTWEDRKNS